MGRHSWVLGLAAHRIRVGCMMTSNYWCDFVLSSWPSVRKTSAEVLAWYSRRLLCPPSLPLVSPAGTDTAPADAVCSTSPPCASAGYLAAVAVATTVTVAAVASAPTSPTPSVTGGATVVAGAAVSSPPLPLQPLRVIPLPLLRAMPLPLLRLSVALRCLLSVRQPAQLLSRSPSRWQLRALSW